MFGQSRHTDTQTEEKVKACRTGLLPFRAAIRPQISRCCGGTEMSPFGFGNALFYGTAAKSLGGCHTWRPIFFISPRLNVHVQFDYWPSTPLLSPLCFEKKLGWSTPDPLLCTCTIWNPPLNYLPPSLRIMPMAVHSLPANRKHIGACRLLLLQYDFVTGSIVQ